MKKLYQMTAREKRVAIAQDILLYLDKGMFTSAQCSFVTIYTNVYEKFKGQPACDLLDIPPQEYAICEVCAKGAAYVALQIRKECEAGKGLLLKDEALSLSVTAWDNRIVGPLLPYFSRRALDDMEQLLEEPDFTMVAASNIRENTRLHFQHQFPFRGKRLRVLWEFVAETGNFLFPDFAKKHGLIA